MNIGHPSYQHTIQAPSLQNAMTLKVVDQRNEGSVLKPVTKADTARQGLTVSEKPPSEKQSAPPQNSSNPVDQNELSQQQKLERKLEAQEEIIKQQEIQFLSARDREVKQHERAHAAVGGQYAGAPRYQFERGPDGVNYAVSGEVSISTSKISGDPQATIDKAQVVRRAALAPAEPSPQDRKVAALATQMESQARVELVKMQQQEQVEAKESVDSEESVEQDLNKVDATSATAATNDNSSSGRAIGENDNQIAINKKLTELTQQLNSLGLNGPAKEPGQLLNRLA